MVELAEVCGFCEKNGSVDLAIRLVSLYKV